MKSVLTFLDLCGVQRPEAGKRHFIIEGVSEASRFWVCAKITPHRQCDWKVINGVLWQMWFASLRCTWSDPWEWPWCDVLHICCLHSVVDFNVEPIDAPSPSPRISCRLVVIGCTNIWNGDGGTSLRPQKRHRLVQVCHYEWGTFQKWYLILPLHFNPGKLSRESIAGIHVLTVMTRTISMWTFGTSWRACWM